MKRLIPLLLAFSGLAFGGAAYRSSSAVAYASHTSTTITAPTGIQNNDILIIFFLLGASSPPTPTPPSGFSVLTGFPVTVTNGGFSVSSYCWYKVASSESGNYTVTHSTSSSAAYMVAVSGGVTTSAPTATTNTGTGSTTTMLSITTTNANSFIMAVNQDWGDFSNTLTPPSGSTPTFTSRLSELILFAADGVLATAGATGNKTMTNNNNGALGTPWSGYLIKVEASTGGPTKTCTMTLLGAGPC